MIQNIKLLLLPLQ